jgi:hypothetical protein
MPTIAAPAPLAPYRVVDAKSGRVLCHCDGRRPAEGKAFIHSLLRSGSRVFAVQQRVGDGWKTISQTT